MRRRRFVVGLGGVAGGGSLLVGSEAFSAAEVERETTVGVDSDAEAVVRVTCGDTSNCEVTDGEFSNNISYTRTAVSRGRDRPISTSIDDASFEVGNLFREVPEIEVTVEADNLADVKIAYLSHDDSSATITEGGSAEFSPQITVVDIPCSVDDSIEIRLKIRRPGEDDPFGTITREVEVDVEVEYEEVKKKSDSANW